MNIKRIKYYFEATYRRKILDKLLRKYKNFYHGIVLDIGGRRRGNFEKPLNLIDRWIVADINEKYKPDIVMDVADMYKIEDKSIDVVNAIELFEHVRDIQKSLNECYRILRDGGIIIISVPFLFPFHADPNDYQRWTNKKWEAELLLAHFNVEIINIMGGYFTIMADMLKDLIKNLPSIIKWFFYLFFPFFDLMTGLDKLICDKSKLNKYHGGYFIIAKK